MGSFEMVSSLCILSLVSVSQFCAIFFEGLFVVLKFKWIKIYETSSNLAKAKNPNFWTPSWLFLKMSEFQGIPATRCPRVYAVPLGQTSHRTSDTAALPKQWQSLHRTKGQEHNCNRNFWRPPPKWGHMSSVWGGVKKAWSIPRYKYDNGWWRFFSCFK